MEALSLNGITSRAIQWSRPGRWSWLALLLFIGSLLVAVQFRGSIVEQMQYREHFGDAASLATLNNIILGFSTALVVAAAVISWRVWWTFSLIGTTALGMPDLGAIGAGWLRASALWLATKVLALTVKFLRLAISTPSIYLGKGIARAGHHLVLAIKAVSLALGRLLAFVGKYLWLAVSTPFIYLAKWIAWAGKYLGLAIKAVSLALGRLLAFVGKYLWLAISTPFIYLARWIAWAGKYLGLGIKAVSLVLWPVLVFSVKYLGLGINAISSALWRLLEFVSKYLWLAISTPFIYLAKWIAWTAKRLGLGIKAVFLALGRVLAFTVKYLWLAISTFFIYLARWIAWASKYLGLGIKAVSLALGRVLALAVKCLGLAISTPFIYLGKGIALFGKYLGLRVKAVTLALGRVLAFTARCLWLAISTTFNYLGKGIAWTGNRLGLGIKAVSLALGRVLAFTVKCLWLSISIPFIYLGKGIARAGKRLGLVIKAVTLALGRVLAFVGKCLWLSISMPFIYLAKGIAWTGKRLGLGIKAVSLALWRILEFVGKCLGLGIKAVSLALGRVLAFTVKYLWVGVKAVFLMLWRVLAFVGRGLVLAISTPSIYLAKGMAWTCKHLGLGIKAGSLVLWRILEVVGRGLWLAISTPLIYLGKGIAFVGEYLGLGISTLLTVAGKALALVWWRLRSPIATFFGYLRPALLFLLVSPYILASFLAYLLIKTLASQAVTLGAQQFWRAISIPSIRLVKVTAEAWRFIYPAIASFFQLAGMALAYAVEGLLLAIFIPFIYLGKGIAWTVKSVGSGASLLLLGLIHGLAFASRPVRRAVSSSFQNQATRLQSLGRCLWAAAYTMGGDLRAGLSLLGRFAAVVLAASPRYARAGLIFVLSNLAVAVGVLVFSPLILLRLGVDKTFRQQLAARSGRLWAVLKVRPALGLLCLAVTVIIGLSPWYVSRLLPSETPLEVLIWTSEEKHAVLQSALHRFNEGSATVTVDGRRYPVQARAVPMPATEMYDHLVAKFDRGTAFPLEIGFPTVVSPASSDWLGQINLETGREVFQLDHLRPIVRTPVVVAAARGTAECLGWPKRPVGWADLIALEDKPEVWAACPAAGSDWGPPLTLGDPATSPTARSALQALHLVGAGKLAEEFSLIDVEGPWVEELASRVRAASQPLALGSGGFPRDRNLSLVSGHFQPVEEYQVAQYYLGRSEATDGPDSEPDSEIVAIYPREGTMWHDNPYGIVNATWVSQEHREAALLVQQHLRSREEQDRFMEDGFRPGIYLEPREVLTPTRGLNLKQPQTFLGRLSPEVARAIQISWEAEISR